LFVDECGEELLPLYEAKMINFYDHRAGTYEGRIDGRGYRVLPSPTLEQYGDPNYLVQPFYWVGKQDTAERMIDGWDRQWLLIFKDVTAATNERTVISTIIPMAGVGHTSPIIFSQKSPKLLASLLGNFNCLTLDYVARQKVGGLHLTYFYVKQFPVLPPETYTEADLAFIVPRVLELTYTAWDMKPWAQDLGYDGEPFTFGGSGHPALPPHKAIPGQNTERRATLRAELDAWYARAYGLTRDELRYVLDPTGVEGPDYPSETFRVLQKNDLKNYGEYRTQRLVLEAWDKLERGELDSVQDPYRIAAQQYAPLAKKQEIMRRSTPHLQYLPDTVPCCEAEDWLAGVVCDLVIQGGPASEQDLRMVLLTQVDAGEHNEALSQWCSQERLERLPAVIRWLENLFKVPLGQPLEITSNETLSNVIGDPRTREVAELLLSTYQNQQRILDSLKTSERADADGAALTETHKQA
jgi:hypothetical protein